MSDHTSDFPQTKVCTKCGMEYPRTAEYFHCNKARKDGLRARCKVCQRESAARYYADNYDKERERGIRYRKENPDKVRECSTRYREENREKMRERTARWIAKNPEKVRESYARYYKENRDRKRKENARWYKENPEKSRAKNHRRRAQQRETEGSFTAADIERQRKAQKGKCYYASPECSGKLTIEHLVPLARGGTNNPDNIVLACEHHNFSKNDKLPHEFPKGGRLL